MRHSKTTRTKVTSRNGYVLLTVVVMIAVSALMLARLSTNSMRIAAAAIAEEQAMRHHWAVTSLRRYSLDSAESLLDVANQSVRAGEAEAVLWTDVELADQRWRVVIADESAKLNLLRLSKGSDPAKTVAMLESLRTGSPGLPVSVSIDDAIRGASSRWDQWLSVPQEGRNGRHSTIGRQLAETTQRTTLWGKGQLNVTRAHSETVDALWRHLFGAPAPRQLHSVRGQIPPPPAQSMIGSLALRESQSEIAQRWFSTESQCFSVWVFCQSDRRVADSFFVEWGNDPSTRNRRGYNY